MNLSYTTPLIPVWTWKKQKNQNYMYNRCYIYLIKQTDNNFVKRFLRYQHWQLDEQGTNHCHTQKFCFWMWDNNHNLVLCVSWITPKKAASVYQKSINNWNGESLVDTVYPKRSFFALVFFLLEQLIGKSGHIFFYGVSLLLKNNTINSVLF